jgi:NADPH:quinone reductase-like Zn-dependent oxidoreductase
MGCDGAGEVSALGAGVEAPAVGERVLLDPGVSCGRCSRCLGGEASLCSSYKILGEQTGGTLADYVAVPARNCHPIPAGLDFEQAAALPLVFMTAWRMLATRARVQAGEDVLVLGATGGVGTAACQIARAMGARVLALSGSPDKRPKLEALGVDAILEAPLDGFHKQVRRFTDGRGVQVVLDSLGAEAWASSLKSLAGGGRLVTCGATTGPMAPTDLRHVFFRQLQILGSTMGSGAELAATLKGVERGVLRPVVDSCFELDQIRQAHERLESRRVFGKVVVRL